MTSTWMQGFTRRSFDLPDSTAVARVGGNPAGPVLVLLHGFPQTHVMWHRVAQALADRFFIVMPDLRGYGDSALKPGVAELPDHSQHSKRAMAADVVAVLDALGVEQFFLCGHDRGGRVAHRLALDFAQRVRGLCVIDIAPTLDMYARTDMEFARAYYHWFHLIQPAPLPETMIGGAPQAYLHHKLGGWNYPAAGNATAPATATATTDTATTAATASPASAPPPHAPLGFIEPEALAEYERCFCRPAAIHSACEDYRASAGIDLAHDRASRERGERIACTTLVLWGQRGVVQRMFNPMALWQAQCAAKVSGEALPAGHFIPEELPETTAWALSDFFLGAGAGVQAQAGGQAGE